MAFFALPAVPVVLNWLGFGAAVGTAHVLAPGREEREQSLAQIFTGANDDANSRAAPIARSETCADCEAPDDCLVGEYKQIKQACNARGGEAHHIVPDMIYRLSTAPTSEFTRSTTLSRAPNAPTYNEGMAICLSKEQHRSVGLGPEDDEGVHPGLERDMAAVGMASPVAGTAPIGALLASSVDALYRTPGLSEECKAKASAAATQQVMSRTGVQAPGRAIARPLPQGNAYTVIHRGYY